MPCAHDSLAAPWKRVDGRGGDSACTDTEPTGGYQPRGRGAGGAGGLGCDGAQGYRVQQHVMVMRWGGIEWTLIENQEHPQTSWVTEHDAGAWEQQGDMCCQHSPAGTWGS